jgi:protein-S-isoprenylcysteine O-methyltransferase Ste14
MKLLLPPVVWIATIAAMLLTHEMFPIAHTEPTTWRTLLGFSLFFSGLAITVWHKRLFRKEGTNIDTFGKPDQLVEKSLFKHTRNPMYLGFVVSLAALALVMGAVSPWFLVLGFFVLAHTWYICIEEREMQSKFGAAYREYCSRTPRWLW